MTYKFEAILQQVEDKDATFIEIPFDVEKEFGSKRVKVKAKFDNVDYRGSIVRMGMPCFMIGLTKEIRKKIGKGIGDTVSVEIEKDEDERIVEIPIEFESMLNGNNNAKDFFNSLSYSQKKKYITWITSAKKEETKIKRMNEALLKLEGKVKL